MTELLYLLVGAGLTMAAQALIQLRVVPRVEARKRREDRWERDVLALGELLTAELPDRANAARSEQWLLQVIARDADEVGLDAERKAELLRQRSERARRSVKEYDALANTRLSWLVKRVIGVAPQSAELERFDALYWRFHTTSTVCTFYIRPDDDFDEDRYEQNWRREGQLRDELTAAVEELIGNPPPRSPSRLRRARRRLAERRTARQAKRVPERPSPQAEAGEDA